MAGYVVRIDLKKIDDLIARKGVWVNWYRTRRCPCLDDQAYTRVDCPGCFGLGFLRDDPKRLRGLLTNHSAKSRREPAGLIEAGSRSFTPPRVVRMTEGDLIVPIQGRIRTSEVLTYGEVVPNGSKLDALFPREVIRVESVRGVGVHTFDPAGYLLGPDGSLTWSGADTPNPGERISVEYYHHEAYVVHRDEKAMTRFAEDKRLPDKVTLKIFTRRVLRTA